MHRRWVGAMVLVAAVLALLIVNRTGGRGEPGVAIPAPPMPIPIDGSCLAPTLDEPAWIEVPCAVPHSAEVVGARRTPPPGPSDERFDENGMYRGDLGTCDALGDPFNSSDQQWGMRRPPLVGTEVAVGGPTGWTGCIVTPIDGNGEVIDYRGRVLAATSAAEIPPSLRLCFASGIRSKPAGETVLRREDIGIVTPCSTLHQWEAVAELQGWGPQGDDSAAAAASDGRDLSGRCRAAADRVVGSSAQFAGETSLQVAYDVAAGAPEGYVGTEDLPAPEGPFNVMSFGSGTYCYVGAPAGWLLTDSVVGIGDEKLPLVRP